jgi:hypothetical protein
LQGVPSRISFMLAAIWAVGALAWFSRADYNAIQNAASAACGQSHVPQVEFATCMTMMQSVASATMWNLFFAHDCLWALLPAAAVLIIGRVVTGFRGRRAAVGR